MKNRSILLAVAAVSCAAVSLVRAQGAPAAPQAPLPMMQASPVLKAVDANSDGSISAAELAGAPARLRTLDKNADGKLVRAEAAVSLIALRGSGPGPGPGREGRGEGGGREGRGEGRGEREEEQIPSPGPTADDLLKSLLTFDKNKDGKLQKAELPARLQGTLERADADKNNVLDADELKKLTADQAAAPPAPPARRTFAPYDPASALDTDKDGEISAAEIDAAPTSLKALDKNNDGVITEDDVRLPAGRGGVR